RVVPPGPGSGGVGEPAERGAASGGAIGRADEGLQRSHQARAALSAARSARRRISMEASMHELTPVWRPGLLRLRDYLSSRRRLPHLAFGVPLLAAPAAFGQTPTATVLGTVQDATGGIIAAATVKIQNAGTTETRVVTSDGRGEFTAAQLPPGRYDISIE